MSIKHLLSYIVRGTSSEAFQKLLEMTPYNLKTERRTLQDILTNVILPPSKTSSKNDGVRANENPRNICETNYRNDVKVMIFVAIINRMVPIVHPFLDDDGHLSPVNGVSYLSLLQDIIWHSLRHSATRSSLWWIQDGAPLHCTNAALEFLNKTFRDRVTSRSRTENSWPGHSPDLTPLNFEFVWKKQIPLSLSYNVSKPSLKNIARRRSKTFARVSWSVRLSVIRLKGVIFSNFCKASEDVPLTI